MNSNITGDTHSISVQDGRLILTWQGWYFPPTPGGGAVSGQKCGGTLDLTAHLEDIVRRIVSENSK
jgi:hypothetical protein